MKTMPAISQSNAIDIFCGEFSVKLQWCKEYTENDESYYQLIYVPEPSGLAFIDAQTGEKY
ncbi:hypothetical protein J9303_13415 [Bacillaceae bacterium Marseille-Q3522]|nr:hypothetical protein [Bacillaceae bacterium Marseille-Q3522]